MPGLSIVDNDESDLGGIEVLTPVVGDVVEVEVVEFGDLQLPDDETSLVVVVVVALEMDTLVDADDCISDCMTGVNDSNGEEDELVIGVDDVTLLFLLENGLSIWDKFSPVFNVTGLT